MLRIPHLLLLFSLPQIMLGHTKPWAIHGPTIYTEHGLTQNPLIIEGTRFSSANTSNSELETQELPAQWHILPGFIDIHTHGLAGADIMDGSLESLKIISEGLAQEGTTAFLATTCTADIITTNKACEAVAEYRKSNDFKNHAEVLGLHLEGPFLCTKKAGAQKEADIRKPDLDLFNQWQKEAEGSVRMLTLAPEKAGSLLVIKELKKQGIVLSLGHSSSTYEEAITAINEGCSHATHLFNCMPGIHHRIPGPVTAFLTDDRTTVEIIPDNVHLNPHILPLVWKTKGREGVILVTDAMKAKGLQDGFYRFAGKDVEVKNGIARLQQGGNIAGSTATMIQLVQNMLDATDCTLEDITYMTAANPAKKLGIWDQKGSIAPGKDADCVILDENLQVRMTICRGKVAYSNL